MKIKKITSRNRRDFSADYECEHCGTIETDVNSYDDAHFHDVLIPKMKCKDCGRIAKDYIPQSPKYAANEIV